MQSPKSVETLLKSTYPLQIAIRCSETVETICQKNSLSFVELLRPFCSLNGPYTLKDVQGHQYTVRNVVVKVTAPYGEPVPDAKLRIDLGNCVKWCSGEEGKTPWFDKYRDTFLDHLKQSDHECIKHYVCVVMVVSSTVANPLEAFSQLLTAQKQSEQQSKYPKWLTPHLLYQYVLLHDLSEGGDERARDNYAKVEGTYGGASCFFLHINSRASGSPGKNVPDLWSDLLRSGSETNDDEVDGRFKLKLRKSNKSSKESSPIVPNNKGKSPTNNAVPDPNSARKEPTLFTISTSDSDLNNSQAVAVGNDPLTQNSGTIHHALSNADFTGGESCEKYVTNGSIEGGRETGSVRYGQCLKIEDHERLAGFVQELVGKRLLPHLSEVLKNLNEWLLSRRSVRRSFSSFSSKIAKMIQGPSNSAGEGVGYATNSMEVQLRQLADLAFLTQNYDLSFQSYHHVKKDFQSSSAWSYYAAAVEMCAVAAYMCSSSKREVVSYLEEAVSVYNLSCKAPYHALRCSLLLCKILQERGLTRELTQLFIRMTSEDDDLRSALCLEQAAHSFQHTVPSMERKFALHLILAGHRYARSTQRLHSTRVYGQALKVYIDKGWTLAEDYIHFSLARHSFTLHRLSEARRAFEALLSHDSRQSTAQQMLNLKEYIFVYKQLQSLEPSPPTLPVRPPTSTLSQVSQATPLPTLPLPFVNNRLTRVTLLTGAPPTSLNRPHSLAGGDQSNSSTSLGQYLNSKKQQSGNSLANLIIGINDYDHSKMKATKDDWVKMEERAAAGVGGVLHENFKPSVLIMDEASDNSSSPVMVVNEPVSVGLVLRNPLKIPLLMTNVALIWSYSTPGTSVSSLPASNEERPPPEASCDVLDTVLLKPEEERMVTLRITPHKEGHLAVTGFLYNLCIDTTQSESTDSPVLSSHTRPNLPSMAVSTQDVLYQKRHSSGVSEVMATGLQGKVDVCIQGQRLNQTKEERAGVVYGADHRLSWTVAAPMPKIVACLNSLPSALNRGEVCRVAMEVYNCGQVPLNSLRIATSLGGKLLFDKECDTSSSGVYPSTLLSPVNTSPSPTHPLPHTLTPPHCVELSLPSGRLEPGVGVCAKLIMQGTSSLTSTRQGWGEIPLDLLIYYEPALVSANSKLSHRVLRHSCSLKINESLNLKATAVHAQLPITSSDKEHFDLNRVLLTVEAENKLSPGVAGEVRITQVSCVSPSWSITKTDRGQGLLCLQPSESGVVQLRGTRLPTHTTNLCYSDVPLGPTVIPSSVFPTGNLLRTEESIQKPKRDQLSLVVFWQALVTGEADTMFTYGHQTISVKLPQSMSTLAQTEPTSPYDIVKFYLEHPLVSDYPPSGLCVVPVRVVLQNCCSSNVTAMLEMMQPKEQIEDTHNRSVEPQFYWSGGTCRRHVSLSADSASSSITIYANFGKPGVYNLNTLRVLVAKGNGGGYSTQRWQRTSYITIK